MLGRPLRLDGRLAPLHNTPGGCLLLFAEEAGATDLPDVFFLRDRGVTRSGADAICAEVLDFSSNALHSPGHVGRSLPPTAISLARPFLELVPFHRRLHD